MAFLSGPSPGGMGAEAYPQNKHVGGVEGVSHLHNMVI